MRYRALIHYKNDEEVHGETFANFFEALADLTELVNKEVMSEDGFDPEDVQFAQVDTLSEEG